MSKGERNMDNYRECENGIKVRILCDDRDRGCSPFSTDYKIIGLTQEDSGEYLLAWNEAGEVTMPFGIKEKPDSTWNLIRQTAER